MQAKRVIAKARHSRPPSKRPHAPRPDLLSSLPPDVSALIIDRLRPDDLRHVPLVSPTWASFFSPCSPLEPCLRALVARRFGLRARPDRRSWGELYLALRRERCHLCPAPDVAPFMYAGSSSLALLLQPHVKAASLALFPVCKRCFRAMLCRPVVAFVPVVEEAALRSLSPEVKGGELVLETGFLYSDIPPFTERAATDLDKRVHYATGHHLLAVSRDFRRRFSLGLAEDPHTIMPQ